MLSVIPEQKGDCIQRRQTDNCVDNPRYNHKASAKNCGNQIVIKEAYQSPVDSAYNQKNEN